MLTALIYLTCAFVTINILATILIFRELDKRNIKINIFLVRIYIFKYLNQYKEITIEESGNPGLLYYL